MGFTFSCIYYGKEHQQFFQRQLIFFFAMFMFSIARCMPMLREKHWHIP